MKKRTEFLDIRTLEDLDAAIHRTRERIQAQGESVHDGLVEVRGFYTPRNIALQGVKKFAWEHNLFVIGLNAVRSLKNLLQK
jgi:predicted amidohydrolase